MTASEIRALAAAGMNRQELAWAVGPRSRARISAALRPRKAATYRDGSGVRRYVSNGARAPV